MQSQMILAFFFYIITHFINSKHVKFQNCVGQHMTRKKAGLWENRDRES